MQQIHVVAYDDDDIYTLQTMRHSFIFIAPGADLFFGGQRLERHGERERIAVYFYQKTNSRR